MYLGHQKPGNFFSVPLGQWSLLKITICSLVDPKSKSLLRDFVTMCDSASARNEFVLFCRLCLMWRHAPHQISHPPAPGDEGSHHNWRKNRKRRKESLEILKIITYFDDILIEMRNSKSHSQFPWTCKKSKRLRELHYVSQYVVLWQSYTLHTDKSPG